MSTPLLVHFVFHPASNEARALAVELHRALNDDPALPGLRVPTVLVAEDGTGHPPLQHALDEAQNSIVVVLADDDLNSEPDTLPLGRQLWSTFIGDLWERCCDGRHRFLPVQLTKHAWPLDPRLEETSFHKAFLQPQAERTAWTTRIVVVELVRFLMGQERGTKVPVRVFLSHAKQDIHSAPQVFSEIVKHLDATQPVETWVDSAKIEGGSEFSTAIAEGVHDSVLLALVTKSYSGRPWCRREVLLAKEKNRPLVVVDALDDLDLRRFPYIGNTPVMRWTDGSAARAVDLMLKETLRHFHTRCVLKAQMRKGDVVLTVPPELATLVRLPKGAGVLYPDPPLGDEELELFEPLGHHIETPLQRASAGQPLAGLTLALSISESDDPHRYGVLPEHLDAALVEVSRYLLVRGASLAYGGHLGKQGYTATLFNLVKAHQSMSGIPPVERIRNYVGWPLSISKEQRSEYRKLATFVRVSRPEGIEDLEAGTFTEEPPWFPADNEKRRYAWARGMTVMRERQVKEVQARILMGGKAGPTLTATPDGGKKEQWYSGRIPGVIEEALLTLAANGALYVVGAFGGASAVLVDLLEDRPRREFTWDYQRQAPHAEGMRRLYDERGVRWWDYSEMTEFLRTTGVEGLSRGNELSGPENRELFWTRDVNRIIELILTGLSRLRAKK
ncbi:TIR domain-containing protein [Corallococcus carmarthensis]|uniref:TIR domain-containing protein n=1 Tax=Corallococcus carmarthensis TaxID=2316728 RepID=UPI0011C47062|nr:TIR domain-containing protein [Corallococcus carmarthensis]NOK15824.1 TIR domain-containing protein [Corallococcus carmarthensis]